MSATEPRPCLHCQAPILGRFERALYCSSARKRMTSDAARRAARLQRNPRTLARTVIDGIPLAPLVAKRLRAQATLDAEILKHWRSGLDTADIAKRTGRPQAEIANRLALLRDRERQAVLSEAS